MEEQIPWGKIQYHLKNKAEPFDDEFISWLKASDKNSTLWDEIQLMYSMTGQLPDQFAPNEKEAWKKIDQRISLKKPSTTISQFFLRVAASILLIVLGASASWFLFEQLRTPVYAEVYSPYGHKTKVILPDSSLVWLNGDSKLRYETSFKKSRNIELSGEALFEVRKDKKRAFSVQSRDLKVEVYGTTFNFKQYPEERNAEVALVEGSIGLFSDNRFLEKMVAGEVAEYNLANKSINISKKNINQIISWSTDELNIKNEKFEDVINYLERWYGVEIVADGDLSTIHRLSFKVKTESLQEVLSVINLVLPIDYKIDGKKVIISKSKTQ
jgi:ferric-dicitrate binding protein FerR (iron transport regulator)